jgi:penicillin amidase
MIELLDTAALLTARDHWRFMWDSRNTMAAGMAPLMAEALIAQEDTGHLGEMLRAWNFVDDPAQVAPMVFQATWHHFARLTFEDELGAELTARMLENWYFWQERLYRMASDNANTWFDDVTTAVVESRDDLFVRAARLASQELTEKWGPDTGNWRWGRAHTVTFFSPTLPGEWFAGILGGGTHAKDGSGDTINRARYKYAQPYAAATIASMRFVADFGDPDRVMAVLSGGASGRQFSPHLKDQLSAWLSAEPRYWWFSDAAIGAHARHELHLQP